MKRSVLVYLNCALVIVLALHAGTVPALSQNAGTSFRDCANVCPEMVTIPPGSFTMGSPVREEGHADSEGPKHQVTINYSFEVGKYDVTREEYA
jgi:formylglycine-generating enzyme required for sulfatase activity